MARVRIDYGLDAYKGEVEDAGRCHSRLERGSGAGGRRVEGEAGEKRGGAGGMGGAGRGETGEGRESRESREMTVEATSERGIVPALV